jgi:hypothetical protein
VGIGHDGDVDGGWGRFGVDQAAMVAALQEHAERLVLPLWPVFALAEADEEGFLGGATESDQGLLAIRFDYRRHDSGQRLRVETRPDDGRVVDPVAVIRRLMVLEPEEESAAVARSAMAAAHVGRAGAGGEVLVDGEPVSASVYRDGDLAAWLVHAVGVVVVAAAWRTRLDRLSLTRVTDLAPFKRRRALFVEQWLSEHLPS